MYRQNASTNTVLPRSVRNHGMFGLTFLRQHMLADDRWTPTSLSTEFNGMAELLSRKMITEKFEDRAKQKIAKEENKNLKIENADGYTKLKNVLHGGTRQQVRNELVNHKNLQRLYQKIPIEMAVVNINQRTFVITKERDRLAFRLKQLKSEYHDKLMTCARLETIIKYQNEFVISEDVKSRRFLMEIENSNTRLNAVKTINGTYRKMIQILHHDAIFYEPILNSLSRDIQDQGNFIRHVLQLGSPAIKKFKELSDEYRILEDKTRRSLLDKFNDMTVYRKDNVYRRLSSTSRYLAKAGEINRISRSSKKRFARETTSMMVLKRHLEAIEETIKRVKVATLCAKSADIYPRIKQQMANNDNVQKKFLYDMIRHNSVYSRQKRAYLLSGLLMHNLGDEEMKRLNHINALREAIAKEDEKERISIQHMKNRSDAFVTIRYSLWNLSEIMRYVSKPPKLSRITYSNSYMKLPLLKFEMYTMRAYAPDQYERNTETLMRTVKRKLHILMRAFKGKYTSRDVHKHTKAYMELAADFVEVIEDDGTVDLRRPTIHALPDVEEEDEFMTDAKVGSGVAGRRYIKNESAKVVDDALRRED